jgi:hypothetical protein
VVEVETVKYGNVVLNITGFTCSYACAVLWCSIFKLCLESHALKNLLPQTYCTLLHTQKYPWWMCVWILVVDHFGCSPNWFGSYLWISEPNFYYWMWSSG